MLQINTLTRLDLGVKDENNARDLYIDMNAWYTDYPNGTVSIWHKRNGDQTKYAASGVTFDRETGILQWTPDAYDTFYVGKGVAEIRLTENNVIKKTKDIGTEVAKSLVLGSGETLTSGWQNFLNAVESAKNAAVQAAESVDGAVDDAEAAAGAAEDAQEAAETAKQGAEAAVLHYPYIDQQTGKWMIWDAETSAFVAAGEARGPQGNPGNDGYSPTISITDITGGHRVSITDANGTSTFDVMDGTDGTDGTDGDDGVSPTITITNITGGHRVSVTDAEGTSSFDVMDGTDGDDGTDGTSAYVHIRYAATQPTADADMKTTPDEWIGIYSGSSATAPTAYTSYTWYKFKGETGTAENVYGSTVPMSPMDSTKIETAINGKTDKVSGATSGNFAGLDANGNLTDSGKKASDFLTQHQDITGKADKVSSPTDGNFAGLDSNGNPTDSGKKASDFAAASHTHNYHGENLPIADESPDTIRQYIDDNLEQIVPEYDETETYEIGQIRCNYGVNYRCKTRISTPEDFDSSKWEQVSLSEEVESREQALLDDLDITIRGNKAYHGGSATAVSAGQFVSVRNSTITGVTDGQYTAKNNVSSGVAFTSTDLEAVTAGALNALNSKITNQIKTASKSNLTITTDSTGKYMLGDNEKPSISGYSPIAANISNFSSDDLGGSAYPPSIVLSDNGTFYFMGSPNKTYHSIGVRAVMRKN